MTSLTNGYHDQANNEKCKSTHMPHRKVDNLVGGAPSVSEVSLADAYTVFQYDVGGVVLYQGFVSIKWRHPSINLVELQSECKAGFF